MAAALDGGVKLVFLQMEADRGFRMLGSRIAGSWFAGASARLDMLQPELNCAYQRTDRLAIGSANPFRGLARGRA